MGLPTPRRPTTARSKSRLMDTARHPTPAGSPPLRTQTLRPAAGILLLLLPLSLGAWLLERPLIYLQRAYVATEHPDDQEAAASIQTDHPHCRLGH